MAKQKLKTRVIKKDVNPEWNEDLTLSVSDPNLPIKLTVYDHDTFTKDDKMGDAEFDIRAYIDALKMKLKDLPSGTKITRVQPSRQNAWLYSCDYGATWENCLAEESCITWNEGKLVQDLCLRLRNVECGEVEIQLQWIDLPGSKGVGSNGKDLGLEDMLSSSLSISGENKHYGTPDNPAASGRLPGGSSSGAAVAVAANLVDFSLGVDTVGGVRIPAGFCGILGFRPSHGAVSHVGVIPISTSLDAIGWFAKDPNILRRVGHVLLQLPYAVQRSPRQIIIADDCFQHLKIPVDRVAQVVIKSTEMLFGRQILKHENVEGYLESKVPSLKEFHSKKSNGEFKTSSTSLIANVMQFLQRYEFKQNHAEWISLVKPVLDPAISAQIYETLEIPDTVIENYRSIRDEMRSAIHCLLKDDGILVIPTIADPPPKLGGKEILSESYQSRARSLLSIASVSGCCQVAIPLGFHNKCPISVSFIARHGGDRFLLDTVHTMYTSLQEQVDIASKSKVSKNVVSKEQSAEIAKEKGNEAFKDKQWQKAIGFYTEAIKLSGAIATYYSNRALAYLELGSYLQAEADCNQAITLDKKNVKAYLRRATAREMLGYYKEAIEDFRYALVLEPTNKRASQSVERLRKLFQ